MADRSLGITKEINPPDKSAFAGVMAGQAGGLLEIPLETKR
jgi:hypothetical protein